MGAHGVEQRERPAARADHQAQVPVELGHVPGHAAVILGVDLLAGQLERRRLPRQSGLLVANAELVEQRLLAGAGLVLHVHVGVESDEFTVLGLAERVDLGQRHVVLKEQTGEPGHDRREPVQGAAADPKRGDQLLGLPVGEGPDVEKCRRATWSGCSSATCSMSIPPMSENSITGRLRIPSQTTPA